MQSLLFTVTFGWRTFFDKYISYSMDDLDIELGTRDFELQGTHTTYTRQPTYGWLHGSIYIRKSSCYHACSLQFFNIFYFFPILSRIVHFFLIFFVIISKVLNHLILSKMNFIKEICKYIANPIMMNPLYQLRIRT